MFHVKSELIITISLCFFVYSQEGSALELSHGPTKFKALKAQVDSSEIPDFVRISHKGANKPLAGSVETPVVVTHQLEGEDFALQRVFYCQPSVITELKEQAIRFLKDREISYHEYRAYNGGMAIPSLPAEVLLSPDPSLNLFNTWTKYPDDENNEGTVYPLTTWLNRNPVIAKELAEIIAGYPLSIVEVGKIIGKDVIRLDGSNRWARRFPILKEVAILLGDVRNFLMSKIELVQDPKLQMLLTESVARGLDPSIQDIHAQLEVPFKPKMSDEQIEKMSQEEGLSRFFWQTAFSDDSPRSMIAPQYWDRCMVLEVRYSRDISWTRKLSDAVNSFSREFFSQPTLPYQKWDTLELDFRENPSQVRLDVQYFGKVSEYCPINVK